MLAGVLIAGNAHAQSTWIVDKSNGPGAHFTSIQAAVDAAKPNDILELRAGTYEGFTISKGLRLLADPGVWVNTGQGFSGKQVVVTGLALGEAVVLRGFAIDDAYGLGMSVLVAKNQGTAHFEHIRFLAPPTGTSSPAVRIDASLGVSFRRCDISSGVNAIDSAVMLTETSVRRSPDPTQILSSYALVVLIPDRSDARLGRTHTQLAVRDGIRLPRRIENRPDR